MSVCVNRTTTMQGHLCLLITLVLGILIHGYDASCKASKCKLPNCLCPGRDIPGGLSKGDTPQIVLISFDDAINEQNMHFYKELYENESLRNPNGCPISFTFFLSHNWTDYDMVRTLYDAGHEIASHSVTHRLPHSWWAEASYEDWRKEISGQRTNIHEQTQIPTEEIRGSRAPFLQIGGDTQFSVLSNDNFTYDASLLAGEYRLSVARRVAPLWPFTLDFPPFRRWCDITPCPLQPYPGLWEVPLIYWIGINGKPCSMVDTCYGPHNKKEALKYLWSNFNRYFQSNRAPFRVNLHSKWFRVKHNFEAMKEFIEDLVRMDEVYIVSVYEAIQWIKNPTKLANIATFEPWKKSCRKLTTQPPTTSTTTTASTVTTTTSTETTTTTTLTSTTMSTTPNVTSITMNDDVNNEENTTSTTTTPSSENYRSVTLGNFLSTGSSKHRYQLQRTFPAPRSRVNKGWRSPLPPSPYNINANPKLFYPYQSKQPDRHQKYVHQQTSQPAMHHPGNRRMYAKPIRKNPNRDFWTGFNNLVPPTENLRPHAPANFETHHKYHKTENIYNKWKHNQVKETNNEVFESKTSDENGTASEMADTGLTNHTSSPFFAVHTSSASAVSNTQLLMLWAALMKTILHKIYNF